MRCISLTEGWRSGLWTISLGALILYLIWGCHLHLITVEVQSPGGTPEAVDSNGTLTEEELIHDGWEQLTRGLTRGLIGAPGKEIPGAEE